LDETVTVKFTNLRWKGLPDNTNFRLTVATPGNEAYTSPMESLADASLEDLQRLLAKMRITSPKLDYNQVMAAMLKAEALGRVIKEDTFTKGAADPVNQVKFTEALGLLRQ
jgi:hypothetical protein